MTGGRRAQREEHVVAVMMRWAHEATQSASAHLEAFGLTPPTYQALLAIAATPGQTQTWLGATRGTTRSNASLLIAQLVEKGLVRREAVGASHRVFVTDAGTELLAAVVPDHRRWTAARFAALDDRELDLLADLLDRLNRPEAAPADTSEGTRSP